MKYKKEQLTLENGYKKDWIITNGIGGYSSSTILGMNTRKYHGLLVAPLNPPASRYLILSKVDEAIKIGEKTYPLYSNMGKEFISKGYEYLTEFEKEFIPIFTYEIKGVVIKKFICMEYGKNTVSILYNIKNNETRNKFTIAPIMNFRDFHTTSENWDFNIKQTVTNQKVKMIINNHSHLPVYMNLSEGKYVEHTNNKFNNMYYIQEEKRGFPAEENLAVPGVYEVNLRANEEKYITFVCSLEDNIEEIDGKDLINKEIVRLTTLLYNSELIEMDKPVDQKEKTFLRDYIIATDNFVVYRPSFVLHTIVAGYPWFLDWGRDTLISFEGLLLLTKRYKVAQEVLLTCVRDIKYGLVPNGYSGYDNRPLYNSSDASLLLFEQVKKYLNYTQNYEFVKTNIYDSLIKIIEAYCNGIDLDGNNIRLDQEDYLISSGTEKTQNTWMDAKFEGIPVTPRNGKTVELNSMWYNALCIMAELTKLYKDEEKAKKYTEFAKKCKKSFEEKFYNKRRKCLYDVIGDDKIRPNQLFALSLTYPVIDPKSTVAQEIFETVTKKLLTPYGLKTLAKGEEGYKAIYEGDVKSRDTSYHQGITWPWLIGIYADAFKKIIDGQKTAGKKKELKEEYNKFVDGLTNVFLKEMNERSTVGSISEIYDSTKPYEAKGTFAQAWSVAEVFRVIIQNRQNK